MNLSWMWPAGTSMRYLCPGRSNSLGFKIRSSRTSREIGGKNKWKIRGVFEASLFGGSLHQGFSAMFIITWGILWPSVAFTWGYWNDLHLILMCFCQQKQQMSRRSFPRIIIEASTIKSARCALQLMLCLGCKSMVKILKWVWAGFTFSCFCNFWDDSMCLFNNGTKHSWTSNFVKPESAEWTSWASVDLQD